MGGNRNSGYGDGESSGWRLGLRHLPLGEATRRGSVLVTGMTMTMDGCLLALPAHLCPLLTTSPSPRRLAPYPCSCPEDRISCRIHRSPVVVIDLENVDKASLDILGSDRLFSRLYRVIARHVADIAFPFLAPLFVPWEITSTCRELFLRRRRSSSSMSQRAITVVSGLTDRHTDSRIPTLLPAPHRPTTSRPTQCNRHTTTHSPPVSTPPSRAGRLWVPALALA